MSSRVYNSTDGPLIIDRAGRIIGAREHRDDVDVEQAPAKGHVDAGRLLLVDTSPTDEAASQPDAVEAAPKSKATRGRTTTEEA